MTNIALVVKTKVNPGQRDVVRRLWEEHLKPRIQKTPEQEIYFFCDDLDDPDSFFLFEVYSDSAVLARNAEADWFGAYMAAAKPHVDRVDIMRGEPAWRKT